MAASLVFYLCTIVLSAFAILILHCAVGWLSTYVRNTYVCMYIHVMCSVLLVAVVAAVGSIRTYIHTYLHFFTVLRTIAVKTSTTNYTVRACTKKLMDFRLYVCISML